MQQPVAAPKAGVCRPLPAGRGLALLACSALFLGACGGPETESARTDPRAPIVLYLVDTLRADRLGLYGYTKRQTSPILDALAAESVVFDAAYAPAPWTLPL